MRNIEIVRRENRLDSLFKRIEHTAEDSELQSHWTRYLCVLVSGFLEGSIRTTFASYANTHAQSNVASFVTAQLGFLQNPKMGKILVLCHALMFGYTDFSLHRASSIFICQSTPRCAALTSVDQAAVSSRSVVMSPIRRPATH